MVQRAASWITASKEGWMAQKPWKLRRLFKVKRSGFYSLIFFAFKAQLEMGLFQRAADSLHAELASSYGTDGHMLGCIKPLIVRLAFAVVVFSCIVKQFYEDWGCIFLVYSPLCILLLKSQCGGNYGTNEWNAHFLCTFSKQWPLGADLAAQFCYWGCHLAPCYWLSVALLKVSE